MDLLRELGVRTVINAAGGATRVGGALLPPEVLEAMDEASRESLLPVEVQAAASRMVADATGAEAGLVTSGASAALTLAAAAVLAGLDVARMDSLPETDGIPDELLVARPHRNGYDRALRLAGARLVEVGMDERRANTGARSVETWEYRATAGERTAGVVYVARAGGGPPLREVAAFAAEAGLPMIVDAAGVAPPLDRVRELLDEGADLVTVSGGKALRAPQSTGLLCGSADLVASAAVQSLDTDELFELWDPPEDFIPRSRLDGLPRQGVGRGFKVSPAEVVGFLAALRRHRDGEEAEDGRRRVELLSALTHDLADLPLSVRLVPPEPGDGPGVLHLEVGADAGRSAADMSRELRRGDPPVFLGEKRLDEGILIVDPLNLDPERRDAVVRRLQEALGGS